MSLLVMSQVCGCPLGKTSPATSLHPELAPGDRQSRCSPVPQTSPGLLQGAQRLNLHHFPTLAQLMDPPLTLCPLFPQIFIVQVVLQHLPGQARVLPTDTQEMLLIYIRMVTWNQILDPWVYILFRRAVLQRVYPRLHPRPSIVSLSPSLPRKLTAGSVLQ